MKTPIGLILSDVEVIVTIPPQARSDGILAFAELIFWDDDKPMQKVRGITLRDKNFNGKSVIDVDFPAYRAGIKYRKSFIFEDKVLYELVRDMILEEYQNQGGKAPDTPAIQQHNTYTETVNPDEIPI